MAILKANSVYKVNGVKINEKIIPDGTVWEDDAKAQKAGFREGQLYKKQTKLSEGTGKVKFVTIHNTDDIKNVGDDGEQYTRATYNENMGSARVHFYVDDLCAWQNLKAGTGMCKKDPDGSAEVSWHSGDGSVKDGGNMTSLSIEIIMNDIAVHDEKALDNGARLAAWLLWKHKLDISKLVTHTYWVNKSKGKTFTNVDKQCTNMIYGEKWCPYYIFNSTSQKKALSNWKTFKKLVKGYLTKLNNQEKEKKQAEKEESKAAQKAFKPYLVKITSSRHEIRKKAGLDAKAVGHITDKGVYTIIKEAKADSQTWGKLKSGAGWISLKGVKKL